MPRILLAGAIVFALLMSGCKVGGNNSNNNSNANLRVLNVAALAPVVQGANIVSTSTSLDLSLNGGSGLTLEQSGIQQNTLSPYAGYASGTNYTVQLNISGNGPVFVSNTYTFNAGTNYTLVAYGSNGSPGTVLLQDTAPNTPASGQFQIRPINTAQPGTAFDVYVIAVTVTAANPNPPPPQIGTGTQPNFSGSGVGGVPLFQSFGAGTYVLVVTPTGTKNIIYESAPITFNNQDTITADIFSSGSGTLVNMFLMNQNTATTANNMFVPNLVSQFKVTNASQATGPIDVEISPPPTTAVVPGVNPPVNLAFGSSSSYVLVDAAATGLSFIATNAAENLVTCGSIQCAAYLANPGFGGGNDYSTVLVGTPPNAGIIVLLPPDNNLSGGAGLAKIRFVNVSTNAGPLDVQVNNLNYAVGLGINTASDYYTFSQNLLPGYTITANLHGSNSLVLSLTGVEVTGGGVYTIYIMGPQNALQGFVTLDNP